MGGFEWSGFDDIDAVSQTSVESTAYTGMVIVPNLRLIRPLGPYDSCISRK